MNIAELSIELQKFGPWLANIPILTLALWVVGILLYLSLLWNSESPS